MKHFFKTIANILKWMTIIGIVLFSIATFMGKSYVQTLVLILLAVALAWWPKSILSKRHKSMPIISRIVFIIVVITLLATCFKPAHKSSIFISESQQKELIRIYNQKINDWPEDTEDIYITTPYGEVHVLACGSSDNPPLMMLHAASMGAHSWAENLPPLLDHFRIYAVDNIGEGNKSQLNDASVFPNSQKEIADLYALIADSLGIESSPVFGASNGGFIAMSYAFYYPERVESLALFGPMGITPLTGKSIMMLAISSMYPFQFVRDYVALWALGEDDYCHEKYGDWFNCIMKGTIPSVSQPIPMSKEQKESMTLPVILFLGTKDAIVGDAEIAKEAAQKFPNIQIEILESGHLIATEHATTVNQKIQEFLKSKLPEDYIF